MRQKYLKNPCFLEKRKIMTVRQPRYSKEEFARRGDEIYESQVRPQVEADNQGKIVVIDVETGAWEIDTNEISASKRLEARYPDAQIWFVKVGSPYVRRFGASRIHKER
jgi:hypothetical protein